MKKYILAAGLMACVATSFADYWVQTEQSVSSESNARGLYIQADAGWDRTNFVNVFDNNHPSDYTHGNGAIGGGIDIGYRFNKNLGIEAGFMMPFQKLTKTKKQIGGSKSETNKVGTNYSAYGAARIGFDMAQNFNLFMLIGVGYTVLDDPKRALGGIYGDRWKDPDSDALGFFSGAGMDYTFGSGFVAGVKFMQFAASNGHSPSHPGPRVPNTQYYVATLGYKFPI